MTVPALVTLTVWGIPPRQIPNALGRMATQRGAVRDYPGVTFAKLLGTGSGRTFTVRDYDLTHWALLACWDSPQAASAFERSRSARSWNSVCVERLRIELLPLASRGQWSGQQPFGPDALAASSSANSGAVAAITRARLRASTARAFWRAVPDVSKSLSRSPGLMLSLGIGEAPIGFQGTFSVWRSSADLRAFAYDGAEHRRVIERTGQVGWYSEELFARFVVRSIGGTYRGDEVTSTS